VRVLDLFSGIGGFSLGLERTGAFETVAFCEINPFSRRVLQRHWPDVPILEDVTTAEFPEADVITAGFPCQDLSNAGMRAGLSGPRSGLWREVVRAVRMVRPKHVMLENVADLLGLGMGRVVGDLAKAGYDTEWNCIPACDAGAPHERDRIWIVADAEGIRRGEGWTWGLADGLAGLPKPPCWDGQDPVAYFEEREGEPALLGVDDAIPDWMDRVFALGNSLVPDIAEMIGRRIAAVDAERTAA